MMAWCRNFGVKLPVIWEGKLKDHHSHRPSTKPDKNIFGIRGTLYSVVMCVCIFEGKAEKRRGKESWGCGERI